MSPEGAPARGPGALVAIVGPSGAGKDSVMAGAARHPELDPRVRFARRTVTRAPRPDAEDHDSLDEAAFARAAAAGAFSLHWAAHGLRYGLGSAARDDVGRGLAVVANLSRRVLGEAAARFPRLHVVEVTAEPAVLLRRLTARGREDGASVRERIARRAPVALPAGAAGHVLIDNSGDLADAVERLVRHLDGLCGAGGG